MLNETESTSDNRFKLSQEVLVERLDRQAMPNAIYIEDAYKSYGARKKKFFALNNLRMCVPHGAIYGLLGPSGCGKTTLLGCIVNKLKLDSGKIFVFGYEPGTPSAGVPGGRVGYMPQEVALYQEFTISETLQYFGRLHRVPKLTIQIRSNFLVEFLDLPDADRLINELSGGQQRRVSLAAALFHEPELLILDEPTVGVDPLLRSSIWKHLLHVSKNEKTTIIITTHYIEEAKQADKVGLMREGHLLAETTPQYLLDYYGITSLEDVFLKLCAEAPPLKSANFNLNKSTKYSAGQTSQTGRYTLNSAHIRRDTLNSDTTDKNVFIKPWESISATYFSFARCYALLAKNNIKIKRSIWFLLFSFILPPFQAILFCITVGGNPHNLPMAVVNYDTPSLCVNLLLSEKLSDVYLDNLNPDIIKQKSYADFNEGYSSVVDGKTWGLIFFNKSFTNDVIDTSSPHKLCPIRNLGDPTIHVYLDNTNQEISYTIKIVLYKSLENAIAEIAESYPKYNTSEYQLPISMEDEVYGVDNSTFRNFVAPGVILTIIYFIAMGLTALSFVVERKDGLLDRSWVAGVQPGEVMFSHLITQMFIMIVQITLILVFMFPVFGIPCEGNILWVILLSFLQGFCGMTFGLMVSALATNETNAMLLILGLFYPILLLSGIVWPLEGMPSFLRYFAYILPQTFACEGMRAVLYRGWNITHFVVWMGYLMTILWTLLHLAISFVAIKFRK